MSHQITEVYGDNQWFGARWLALYSGGAEQHHEQNQATYCRSLCVNYKPQARQNPGQCYIGREEGNLPQQSDVNISQTVTVDKRDLGQRIGFLDYDRMREIKRNIRLMLLESRRP